MITTDQQVKGLGLWPSADYDNEAAKESGISYFNPLLFTSPDRPHHGQVLQNISDVMQLFDEILKRAEDDTFNFEECLPGLRHLVAIAWAAAQHEGNRPTDAPASPPGENKTESSLDCYDITHELCSIKVLVDAADRAIWQDGCVADDKGLVTDAAYMLRSVSAQISKLIEKI